MNEENNTESYSDAPTELSYDGGEVEYQDEGHYYDNDWTSGLDDNLRGYVQNKGFNAPNELLESYINLEKLIGAPKERIIKLPESYDDFEAFNEIYDRLGRPETPDEYQIGPEDGSDGFSNWAKEVFHNAGLTQRQAMELMENLDAYDQQIQEYQQQEVMAQSQAELEELRREWGHAFDQNLSIAQRATRAFGVPTEAIDALEATMGLGPAMKLFQAIGSSLVEGDFISSNGNHSFDGMLTPEQAMNHINHLKGDNDFVKRYTSGELSAKREMERLHAMAYPDY